MVLELLLDFGPEFGPFTLVVVVLHIGNVLSAFIAPTIAVDHGPDLGWIILC